MYHTVEISAFDKMSNVFEIINNDEDGREFNKKSVEASRAFAVCLRHSANHVFPFSYMAWFRHGGCSLET